MKNDYCEHPEASSEPFFDGFSLVFKFSGEDIFIIDDLSLRSQVASEFSNDVIARFL